MILRYIAEKTVFRIRKGLNTDPDPDHTPSYTHLFFAAVPVYCTLFYDFFYLSRQRHGCHNFQYFRQCIEISVLLWLKSVRIGRPWMRIQIRQNYADPPGSKTLHISG